MTSVGLAGCDLGADGAKIVAEYVHHASGSLTSLDLRSNGIGSEGGKAIAEAIKVKGSLSLKRLAVDKEIEHLSIWPKRSCSASSEAKKVSQRRLEPNPNPNPNPHHNSLTSEIPEILGHICELFAKYFCSDPNQVSRL